MINFFRLILAFVIFSVAVVFTVVAALASWFDEQLMSLAEKVAPR